MLLDIWPTAGDAVAFVKHLKAQRDLAAVTIIVLSDGVDPARVRDALDAGADGVVVIPGNPDDLETMIRRLVPAARKPADAGSRKRAAEAPPPPPCGAIGGGAEHAHDSLAVKLFRNRAWSHHEREVSRRLRAWAQVEREHSRQLVAQAREIRAEIFPSAGDLS